MKKILLIIASLSVTGGIWGQVLYSEDFDNVPGPTAGGAGTYAFPSNMLIRNVDGLTPAASVAYVNEGWERREDFPFNVADSCAYSTSWYSPAGTANDWMWTPLIGPLPAIVELSWNAVAPDVSYADGYEVRVMTAAQGPPTGGTGVIGNQITNSTVVFSTAGENSTWTARTVDLSAYAGQSVYIGFRNNSLDKFLLMVDDIAVTQIASYDAAMYNPLVDEYSMTPVSQITALGTAGDVANEGVSAITNVGMTVNVYDGAMTQVYTANATPVANLAPGATASLSVPGYVPTLPDLYTVELIASLNETDVDLLNNTVSYTVLVTDSTFARDNGTITGTLGIGAGVGGQLGQAFTLTNADNLTSLSFFISNTNGTMTGQPLSGGVWATDVSGVPTTLIASTDTYTVNSSTDSLWTIPIQGGTLSLSPGTYVMVVNEADSNVTIGTANTIFTAAKTWVNWPGTPFGTWANNEDFGFNVSYVLRANFSDACVPNSSTLTESACDSYLWAEDGQTYTASGLYSVTLTNVGGCDSLVYLDLTIETVDFGTTTNGMTITANQAGATYQWINCATNLPISGETGQSFTAAASGEYAVIVSGTVCADTSACVTLDDSGIDELNANDQVKIHPNPSTGNFTVTLNGWTGETAEIEVRDVNGKVVARQFLTATNGSTSVEIKLTDAKPGMYLVTVDSGNEKLTGRVMITAK